MKCPKFVQLCSASWAGRDGSLTNTLYALAEDGRVFRYHASKNTWEMLGTKAWAKTGGEIPKDADQSEIPF